MRATYRMSLSHWAFASERLAGTSSSTDWAIRAMILSLSVTRFVIRAARASQRMFIGICNSYHHRFRNKKKTNVLNEKRKEIFFP